MLLTRRSDKVELLKKVPLFRDLSKKQLGEVAKHADEIESQPGEVLVRQGHLGREFVLILDGKVRVERNDATLAHLGAGDFFGEMALLDGKGRSASVITEDPSRLLVVHSRDFGHLLETVPGLQRKILITLCERLRKLEETVVG